MSIFLRQWRDETIKEQQDKSQTDSKNGERETKKRSAIGTKSRSQDARFLMYTCEQKKAAAVLTLEASWRYLLPSTDFSTKSRFQACRREMSA